MSAFDEWTEQDEAEWQQMRRDDAEYLAWFDAMLPGAMIYAGQPLVGWSGENWDEAFATARAQYDEYLARYAGPREIDWFTLNREVSD